MVMAHIGPFLGEGIICHQLLSTHPSAQRFFWQDSVTLHNLFYYAFLGKELKENMAGCGTINKVALHLCSDRVEKE